MQLQKKVLDSMHKCYAVLGFQENGEPRLAFAGEGDGMLCIYSGADFSKKETVWTDGGGTMSIVQADDSGHLLLASRGFYSMVEAGASTIELIRHEGGVYTHYPIAQLPYLHRFGVVSAQDGRRHVIAATIAQSKASKEDWSHPGHLYAAQLPDDLSAPFTLCWEALPGDFTKNHGFCIAPWQGRPCAYICCEEGTFVAAPPADAAGAWQVHCLMDTPASDIAVLDIDGDGEDELAVIEPFHGNRFVVYKRRGGAYHAVYAYPVMQDFYHAVCAAHLGGENVFLGGARRGPMQLFGIRWRQGRFESFVIDENVGPSNVAALRLPGRDLVLSANRETHEAAFYEVSNADA